MVVMACVLVVKVKRDVSTKGETMPSESIFIASTDPSNFQFKQFDLIPYSDSKQCIPKYFKNISW